jgi:hypothetical protein
MFGELHDNTHGHPNIRDHFVPDSITSELYQARAASDDVIFIYVPARMRSLHTCGHWCWHC